MAQHGKIEQQLNDCENWIFVSNKKHYIKQLKKIIHEQDEFIRAILDGFYSGVKIKDETPGLFCVTNKKLFFIADEKNGNRHEEVDFNKIDKANYKKSHASLEFLITGDHLDVHFKTFSKEVLIKFFIENIWYLKGVVPDGIDTVNKPVTINEETTSRHTDFLNEVYDYIQNISLPGFLDKLTKSNKDQAAEQVEGIQKLRETDKIIEDMTNCNFLYNESKKIYNNLAKIIKSINEADLKENIINDLVVLASLCSIADGSLSNSELIVISLVLMPFNLSNSIEDKDKIKEIYMFDSFPMHYKEDLIDYWQTISSYIKEKGISVKDQSLLTMPYLKKYDEKNGTSYFDQAGSLLYNFSQIVMKSDDTINEVEKQRLQEIHALINNVGNKDVEVAEEVKEETLEEVMEDINKLVGMQKIKDQIQTFINLIKVQKEREARELPTTPLSLHAVFYGPPGTGKTTIARMLGRVYKCLGLLTKGHLIETDRAGVVAGYVGQTAIKVDEIVQKALDGMLFIDEAYTLSPPDAMGKDFGQEAIDAILKRMEDYRDRLVVIVAGYPDEMERFINSNPGLKSRFSRYFYFDHYTPEELLSIFDIFSANVSFSVTEKAKETLLELLKVCYDERTRSFGNGRLVRNIFEKIVEKQANRIAAISPLTDEILCTIESDDVPLRDEIMN